MQEHEVKHIGKRSLTALCKGAYMPEVPLESA